MRAYNSFWLAIVALCCAVLPLRGQEARGTLLGRVSDPSSAVIVAAKVEAVNDATGVRYSSTTNDSGDFLIPFLIPGPYTITVEHAGFKMYSRKGIVVRVNDQVSINVVLELGEASQTVNVSAESPMLDTSTASMGQVVESRSILELPLKDGMVRSHGDPGAGSDVHSRIRRIRASLRHQFARRRCPSTGRAAAATSS